MPCSEDSFPRVQVATSKVQAGASLSHLKTQGVRGSSLMILRVPRIKASFASASGTDYSERAADVAVTNIGGMKEEDFALARFASDGVIPWVDDRFG